MNECIDRDIQEMLPELLHHTLGSGERERIEYHLATCDSCREELAVLRTVNSAAVFAPAIDVGSIVRQIPPYQRIIPSVQAPARSRVAQWLVAATVAVLLIGGGSLVVNRQPTTVAAVNPAPQIPSSPQQASNQQRPGIQSASSVPTAARGFALSTDVASLSDGDLVQLMNEMDNFDALPATEAEPIIAVDTVDSL
jgi:hypothetical protein